MQSTQDDQTLDYILSGCSNFVHLSFFFLFLFFSSSSFFSAAAAAPPLPCPFSSSSLSFTSSSSHCISIITFMVFQHLRSQQDGQTLDYILSGCANFVDSSTKHKDKVPKGTSLFHWADITKLGGFVFAEASATNMTVTYMDAMGKILFQTALMPRKV